MLMTTHDLLIIPQLSNIINLCLFLISHAFSFYDIYHFCGIDSGAQGGNGGEDIQLTTTITHADGPTEVYRMMGKESQEQLLLSHPCSIISAHQHGHRSFINCSRCARFFQAIRTPYPPYPVLRFILSSVTRFTLPLF